MDDHRHAIGRQHDVKLNRPRAKIGRHGNGGEGIFRRNRTGAAVSDNSKTGPGIGVRGGGLVHHGDTLMNFTEV